MALVPFDDRDGHIWYDGVMMPWRDAKLHVLTHGLHYASGVFEGERAYSGNIFKLRAHTERLINSGRILGFEIPYTADEIDAACIAVLKANGQQDAYIRPVVFAPANMSFALNTESYITIQAWEMQPFLGEKLLSVMTSSFQRPNPKGFMI